MNVFDIHSKIVRDYASYIRSFINISDPAIGQKVDAALAEGKLWPEPLLQFNPAYELAGSITEIAKTGLLHGAITDIFKGYSLYRHQLDAIKLGTTGEDFVVTSGTGSGKSLTYIGTIFHQLLTRTTDERRHGDRRLSDERPHQLPIERSSESIQGNYEHATGRTFPISFGQYTGQEKEEVREKMRENPPRSS